MRRDPAGTHQPWGIPRRAAENRANLPTETARRTLRGCLASQSVAMTVVKPPAPDAATPSYGTAARDERWLTLRAAQPYNLRLHPGTVPFRGFKPS